MDLKQMEYFKTVVDMGNINQAAKTLHMSQPPLSMSMKRLEDELGVVLFKRGTRHVTLTEAGTILYQRAKRILELTENTIADVSKVGKHRTFSIGLTPSTIPVISGFLSRFSDDNPDLKFQIYDGSTFEMKHLLETNIIDAAFLRTPFAPGEFESLTIKKEPMVALIPKSLINYIENFCVKNDAESPISMEFLSKYPLSIYRRYQDLLTNAFKMQGLNSNYFSVCDDARTTMFWAKANKAIAIFPQSLANEADDDSIVCPIDDASLCTNILFVYKKNGSNLISEFLKILASYESL